MSFKSHQPPPFILLLYIFTICDSMKSPLRAVLTVSVPFMCFLMNLKKVLENIKNIKYYTHRKE